MNDGFEDGWMMVVVANAIIKKSGLSWKNAVHDHMKSKI